MICQVWGGGDNGLERLELRSDRVTLRLADITEARKICHYYITNREFLEPFEPLRSDSFFTAAYWKERVKESQYAFQTRKACRFFIFLRNDKNPIIGTVNYNTFEYEPAHSCRLGYGLSKDHQGNGIMYEALQLSIPYIFRQFGIHKIKAAYMPRNERSARLLKRLHFTIYGFARDYIRINGEWEDHVLASLTNPDWISSTKPSETV